MQSASLCRGETIFLFGRAFTPASKEFQSVGKTDLANGGCATSERQLSPSGEVRYHTKKGVS